MPLPGSKSPSEISGTIKNPIRAPKLKILTTVKLSSFLIKFFNLRPHFLIWTLNLILTLFLEQFSPSGTDEVNEILF